MAASRTQAGRGDGKHAQSLRGGVHRLMRCKTSGGGEQKGTGPNDP